MFHEINIKVHLDLWV